MVASSGSSNAAASSAAESSRQRAPFVHASSSADLYRDSLNGSGSSSSGDLGRRAMMNGHHGSGGESAVGNGNGHGFAGGGGRKPVGAGGGGNQAYTFGGGSSESQDYDPDGRDGHHHPYHPHHDSPPPPALPMHGATVSAATTALRDDGHLMLPSPSAAASTAGFRPVDLAQPNGGLSPYSAATLAGQAGWPHASSSSSSAMPSFGGDAAGRRKSLSAGQAAHLAATTSSSSASTSNGYAGGGSYGNHLYPSSSPNYPYAASSSSSRRRPFNRTGSPGEFRTTLSRILAMPRPTLGSIRFIGLCTLWYASSAMSSNTGKAIMTRFRYPVTLTIVQFFYVAAYCWIVTDGMRLARAAPALRALVRALPGSQGRSAAHRRSSSLHHLASSATIGVGAGSLRLRRPTRAILTHTWPMAVFQVGGHIFSSMAISRVPVSTVHTIKALSPLFTVLAYALVFGVSYSPATYLSLLPLTLGVMLATCRDLSLSNALGLICAFGSTLVFVSSNIVFKKLMPSAPAGSGSNGSAGGASNVATGHGGQAAGVHGKLDKINLLFFSSGMAFVLMIPIWAWSDMPALIRMWLEPAAASAASVTGKPATSSPSVAYYFWLNGTVHFAQNYLAFAILSSTSPVTYSIASLVKRIAVICLAIIWFKQSVHPIQAFGIGLTGLGLWMYNNAKRDVEKGEKKVRRMEAAKDGMLPLTRDDHRLMSLDSPDSSRAATPEPEFMSLLGGGSRNKDVHASPRPEYSDLYDASQSMTSAYRPNGFEVPSLQTSSIVVPSQQQLPTRLPNGVGPYPSSSSALPSPPASNSSPPQKHAVPLMSPASMPSGLAAPQASAPPKGARRRQSNDPAMRSSTRPSTNVDDQRSKEVAVL